jgi:hypothetical protein
MLYCKAIVGVPVPESRKRSRLKFRDHYSILLFISVLWWRASDNRHYLSLILTLKPEAQDSDPGVVFVTLPGASATMAAVSVA